MSARSAASVLCWVTAVMAWGSAGFLALAGTFGLAEIALLAVGGTAIAGALCARHRVTDAERELAAEQDAIKAERRELANHRAEIDQFLAKATVELTDRARRILYRPPSFSSH